MSLEPMLGIEKAQLSALACEVKPSVKKKGGIYMSSIA